MEVTVAAGCVPDARGDKDANFAAARELTRRLAAAGAHIVVLPEACVQGYPIADERFSVEQVKAMAEPAEGERVATFRALARDAGIHLVFGYDRCEGERVLNSAELVSPDGHVIGRYDKTHTMLGREPQVYTPGGALPVFETEFGTVGLLICNDRVYAESWRTLMLQGARLVLIPSNGDYSPLNTMRHQVMAVDNCVCWKSVV